MLKLGLEKPEEGYGANLSGSLRHQGIGIPKWEECDWEIPA